VEPNLIVVRHPARIIAGAWNCPISGKILISQANVCVLIA
jgi:hypothetical protein